MKLKHLRDYFNAFNEEQEIDVEIGGVLVPIIDVQASGECKTGIKLVLSKETKLCDAKDTDCVSQIG